ncbi:MAG: hypothetical protein AAF725_16520 [Acidobacteriota bacterium]
MSNAAPPPPPPAPPPPSPPAPTDGPPSGGAAAASSSGLPTWAKVGIGCGCLVLLLVAVGIGLLGWGAKKVAENFSDPAKMAEMLIELNPDLEVVNNDPDAGTITVRDSSSGEEMTFDYSDIESGNFSFEGPDGSFEVNEGGEVVVTDAEGNETARAQAGEQGMTITTDEGVTKIGGSQNIPSWLPLHPDFQFQEGGLAMVQNDKASGMLAGESTGVTLEEAETWYRERLESEGYEIERTSMEFGAAKTVILNATKEGIDTLTVTLADNEGKRSVGLTYSGPA